MVKESAIIIFVFLWTGFVCAISFMEAWLKFRVPGITLRIGLNIGRIVFNALNKTEWVFAFLIAFCLLLSARPLLAPANVFYFLPLTVLIVQTFLLLPVLDARAIAYLKWQVPEPSKFHLYYVAMEIIKTICLFIFGINLLN